MRFKEWIGNLHCLFLNPWKMSAMAEREEARALERTCRTSHRGTGSWRRSVLIRLSG
jgi:hypothetical protein